MTAAVSHQIFRFMRLRSAVLALLGLLVIGCPTEASDTAVAEDAPPPISVETIETALQSAGFEVGERTEKMYALLGAADGAGVAVDGDTIEVYVFDLSITSGRDAFKKLQTDGFMGQSFRTHRNIAYELYDHARAAEIESLLEGL